MGCASPLRCPLHRDPLLREVDIRPLKSVDLAAPKAGATAEQNDHVRLVPVCLGRVRQAPVVAAAVKRRFLF